MTKTQRYRDAQFVLENLRKHRVFYYPGAWIDWEPLLDLTHLCDTFIFCDWNVTEESVTGDFGLAGVTTDFIIPLRKEDVAYLADLGTLPRSVRQGVQALVGEPVDEPWGKYAQLTRTVGNEIRKLHFFYLGMEGITAYFNLFAPHKMAPRVLCMKFGMDPNGKQFWDWDGGLLGYIIRGVGAFPEQPVDFRGPGWDRWIAQDCRPEPVQAGARRVIVKRGALTPGAVTSCDAILLPDSLYKMHRRLWLKRARIILLTLSERLRARSERVIFLGHLWPLGPLLDSLVQTCADRGIERVSSVFIGSASEGPELAKWRQQPGLPLELTIYCECEGDVAAFGPYADEIQ